MSKFNFDSLPNEVLERIFFFCTGHTLARCSMVSKRFYYIISSLQKTFNIWYRCVIDEIEDKIFQELCGNHDTHNIVNFFSNNQVPNLQENPWRSVYSKWFVTRNIHLYTPTIQLIDGFYLNPITCAKISGDLLILGHKDGSVSICDYISSTIQIACRHIRMVTDIALIDLIGLGYYQIYDSRGGSASRHHHIISISKDNYIRAYPVKAMRNNNSCVCKLQTRVEQLSIHVFNNYCVTYGQNLQICIWKIITPSLSDLNSKKPLDMTLQNVLDAPGSYPGWMSFWNNKIFAICGDTATFYTFDFDVYLWTTKKSPTIYACSKSPKKICISKAFIFRDRIVFFITAFKNVYYSVDQETVHTLKVDNIFCSSVVSICLWGSLLAFGLENGRIIVYNCHHTCLLPILDWRKPIFDTKISARRGCESVLSLDISDFGNGPIIIATTSNHISIIKF